MLGMEKSGPQKNSSVYADNLVIKTFRVLRLLYKDTRRQREMMNGLDCPKVGFSRTSLLHVLASPLGLSSLPKTQLGSKCFSNILADTTL